LVPEKGRGESRAAMDHKLEEGEAFAMR
jgi:hypothetical protein